MPKPIDFSHESRYTYDNRDMFPEGDERRQGFAYGEVFWIRNLRMSEYTGHILAHYDDGSQTEWEIVCDTCKRGDYLSVRMGMKSSHNQTWHHMRVHNEDIRGPFKTLAEFRQMVFEFATHSGRFYLDPESVK